MAPRAPRIRPVEGLRALHALIANPDDTAQAFAVIGALTGNANDRLRRRFARDESGRRLLVERPSLFAAFSDVDGLCRRPPGSLGRALGEFWQREQIDVAGLAAAGEEAFASSDRPTPDDELAYVMGRLRDQHDLYHVLTGYGRDVRGELAVLAFTAAQTRNPGVGMIPFYLLFRAGLRSELGRMILSGFKRGLRAAWLPPIAWEAWLDRPLDEVRHALRIGDPPSYRAVRSAGAPQLAGQA